MSYLITEIIVLLVAAALIGIVLGWALFGGKKPDGEADGGKLASDLKAAQQALNDAKARANEAEGKADNMGERIEALEKQLAMAGGNATSDEGRDERIASLEAQLRSRDSEVVRLSAASSSEVSALEVVQLQSRIEEKASEVARLGAELETLRTTGSNPTNASVIAELRAEIAELKATLASGGAIEAADTKAREELAALKIAHTKLEATHRELQSDFESDQQALEEQDAAIDKLTRELVAAQQRIAELEGRTVTPTPTRSSMQVSLPVAQVVMPELPPVAPPAPPAAPPVPAAVDTDDDDDDANEATMAVSLDDLVKAIDGPKAAPTVQPPLSPVPSAPPLPVATPVFVAAPPAPKPPADDDDANESTMAVDLSVLVGQIDASTDVPLSRAPTAAPSLPVAADDADHENESTVALVLGDMANFIDDSATLQQERPAPRVFDDLKLIKGIGPVSEARLNEYGVYTYAELAALDDEDIGALADHVKMSLDRVRPWVEQAKARLSGEEDD